MIRISRPCRRCLLHLLGSGHLSVDYYQHLHHKPSTVESQSVELLRAATLIQFLTHLAPISRAAARLGSLACMLVMSMSVGGCALIYNAVGGAFTGDPAQMRQNLSPGAQQLLDQTLEGIDPNRFADFHVHMISDDVNPSWLSLLLPVKRARTMVYLSAAGVGSNDRAVQDYAQRLIKLIRHSPVRGKYHLFALDRYHRPDGRADLSRMPIYVSNRAVYELSVEHPDIFVPVISVHPYRKDALSTLEFWAKRGCRYIKWLPNTMGIDPLDKQCEPYYRKMKQLGMVLLSHTGGEHALEVNGHDLGNPLRLRLPLELGVKVVALHSASEGTNIDLDKLNNQQKDMNDQADASVPAFDLLLRLMDNPKYDQLLFGETSAMTFYNHLSRPLETLLERPDLQRRFMHGSDYPLTAINMAHQTSALVRAGFLTEQQRQYLNEIYNYNPLLFDFAVKRSVHHPKTGKRLAASVFMLPPALADRSWALAKTLNAPR
jgi:hypothetical protein